MIECEDFSSVNVGETGRTLADRRAEHERHTRLGAADSGKTVEMRVFEGEEYDGP